MPAQITPAASRSCGIGLNYQSAILITRAGVLLLGVALAVSTPGIACDIPVYEYTLTMWQRDPYEVLYLYRGDQGPEDKQVNDYLARTEWGRNSNANFVFTAADVATLEQGQGRRLARQVWEWHKSRDLPFHAVLTPRGAECFVGRLDVSSAKAMLQSAKRKELATQLCDGKRGLLLLLLGPDEAENSSARKGVRDALAEAKTEGVETGFLEVRRDDKSEKWLVDQLLCVEEDLKEIQRPMVFGTFGRAHVLEPFLGKGITYDNMLDLLAFMNGPCSCEIKAASPGMDLLTDWDWDARVSGWAFEEDPAAAAPEPAELASAEATSADVAPQPASPVTAAAPARVKGTPVGSGGAPEAKPAEAKAPAPAAKTAPPISDKRRQAPQRTADRKGPASAASAALDKTPGAQGSDPQPVAAEESRGPALPVGQPVESVPAESGPPLSSELAMGLGLGMGGAAVVAAGVGFLLMWRRREH